MAKGKVKAPSPRRFKHVSWHPTKGRWVVQRKGCASPGCAKTQQAAAKLASSAWGISLAQLRLKMRPASRKRKKSKFAYVYWRAPRAIWYAQARGTFLGRFHSEHEAAKELQRRGVAQSYKELILAKRAQARRNSGQAAASSARPSATPSPTSSATSSLATSSCSLRKHRFKDLWHIYRATRSSQTSRTA